MTERAMDENLTTSVFCSYLINCDRGGIQDCQKWVTEKCKHLFFWRGGCVYSFEDPSKKYVQE